MRPSEDTRQQEIFCQFLSENGVQLSKETTERLYLYADLVVETKQFGNLISPKDSEKILSRHIADSLVPYIYIDERRKTKEASAMKPSTSSLPSRTVLAQGAKTKELRNLFRLSSTSEAIFRLKPGLIWVRARAARFSRSPS